MQNIIHLFFKLYHYFIYKIENIYFSTQLPKLSKGNADFENASQFLLHRMLKYASKSYPFYHPQKNKGLSLDQFPIIDKNVIRANRADFTPIGKDNYFSRHATTGGSTGEPFDFMATEHHDAIHQKFLWKLMGYQKGDIILGIGGFEIPEEQRKQGIYGEQKFGASRVYSDYRLSSIYLNEQTWKDYIRYINQIQPHFIRGYVSAIYCLAKLMEKNHVTLDCSIRGIQLTSETCFDYQIELIKEVFHTKVFLQYGHTEASVFAYSKDESYRYYCSPLYGYTEVLSPNYTPVKEGEIGEVVVTSYSNFLTPFVRYRTGDLAEYGGREHGITILNKVWGRTQDYIYTHSGEKVLLTAIIFGLHFQAFSHIVKWQITQSEYGKIHFLIIPTTDFCPEDEKEISKVFRDNAGIECTFSYVTEIPTTKLGKSKLLIQNLD